MTIFRNILIIVMISTLLIGCDGCREDQKVPSSTPKKGELKGLNVPEFNSDSAYNFIDKQVSFGPRVPNTPSHDSCGEWLIGQLKRFGWEVSVQRSTVKAYDGTQLKMKNIIGSHDPSNKQRLLLCAHWDTRPFADEDFQDVDQPILGANDGASGVGVLLEIARHVGLTDPNIGIDIILFDTEDYGKSNVNNSFCLGSQYWAKHPHKGNYRAKYGILLDMVGASNATFAMEGTSMAYAPKVMRKIWDIGNQIGYSKHFIFKKTQALTDDHYYINELIGIKTIDIIQYDASTRSKFGSYWHTHQDNMDIIDKATLKAVGHTILTVIFYEVAKNKPGS